MNYTSLYMVESLKGDKLHAPMNPKTTDKSEIGFLLIHGFTGTHFEMLPLEVYLKKKGYTVSNITLPGHETSIEDLDSKTYDEWIAYAQKELDSVKKKCDNLFIAGLSLGGVIALILASQNQEISGIITMAAPFTFSKWRFRLFMNPITMFFFKRMMKEEDSWEDKEAFKEHQSYNDFPKKGFNQVITLIEKVQEAVPQISCPSLVIYAKKDMQIPYETALKLFEALSIEKKEIFEIEKGGHVIPEDAGRFQLFEKIDNWLAKEFNL